MGNDPEMCSVIHISSYPVLWFVREFIWINFHFLPQIASLPICHIDTFFWDVASLRAKKVCCSFVDPLSLGNRNCCMKTLQTNQFPSSVLKSSVYHLPDFGQTVVRLWCFTFIREKTKAISEIWLKNLQKRVIQGFFWLILLNVFNAKVYDKMHQYHKTYYLLWI